MSLSIQLQGIDDAIASLTRAGRAGELAGLMERAGALGESQTRRRLSVDKHAPDGTPWPAWSDDYAATRHGGHSLLENQGDLVDSIAYDADADSAEWGSPLEYAAIQNFGGLPGMPPGPGAVPAREYLGLSSADMAELNAMAAKYVDDLFRV